MAGQQAALAGLQAQVELGVEAVGAGAARVDLPAQAGGVSPWISEATAIAPALIIGFSGRPVPGSRLMLLKASPEGSTPTACSTRAGPLCSSAAPYTKGLETLWIAKRWRECPTSYTCPSAVAMAMPKCEGSALASSGM